MYVYPVWHERSNHVLMVQLTGAPAIVFVSAAAVKLKSYSCLRGLLPLLIPRFRISEPARMRVFKTYIFFRRRPRSPSWNPINLVVKSMDEYPCSLT